MAAKEHAHNTVGLWPNTNITGEVFEFKDPARVENVSDVVQRLPFRRRHHRCLYNLDHFLVGGSW